MQSGTIWLPIVDCVRTWCITPEPQIRVQMELQTLHFSGTPKDVVKPEPTLGRKWTRRVQPEA